MKDLYLPGVSLLREIREAYMLDIVDPNKFIFAREDFRRYFYGNSDHTLGLSRLIKESKHLWADGIFKADQPSNYFKEPVSKLQHKNERKTVRNFKQLTVIHLIMYCAQQFLSHSTKVAKTKLQKITDYYAKMIPEYKVNGSFALELMTTSLFDAKKHLIRELFQKNLHRNTTNKSLLNSFINIIDRGLNSDYLKDFLPMVRAVKQTLDDASAVQQSQDKEKFVNLYKYLIPKVQFTEPGGLGFSLLQLYKQMYINIEDKYVKHAADFINYQNYRIDRETQQRVDWFNKFVVTKRNLMFSYIKLRFICEEENLDRLLISIYADLMRLNNDRELLKEQEQRAKEEQKAKEEEMNKRKKAMNVVPEANEEPKQQQQGSAHVDNDDGNTHELNPNKVNYKELISDPKLEERSADDPVVKVKNIREQNASPDIDTFMSSIVIYVIPNNLSNNNMLVQYMSRHDFIYKTLVSKLVFPNSNSKPSPQEIKSQLYLLNMYLMEAKRTIPLNVYLIKVDHKHFSRRRSKEYPEQLNSPPYCPYFCYSFFDISVVPNVHTTRITMYNAKNEKKVYTELSKLKRIIGVNIFPDNLELPNAKYVCNENGKEMALFFVKPEKQFVGDSTKLHEKILALQSMSECFLATKLEISQCTFESFTVDNATYDHSITHLELVKLTYTNSNEQETDFKLNIASFTDIYA